MQLIAEAYDLLRHGAGLPPAEIAEVFRDVERGRPGVVPDRDHRRGARPRRRRDRQAVRRRRAGPGRAEGHRPLDRADRAGPRRAGDRHRRGGVRPRAVRSRRAAGRRARRCPGRPDDAGARAAGTRSSTTSAQALYASKVVAYAQGFDQIAAASDRVRLGHRPRRDGDDLARRLHHPGPLPGPDQRGLRHATPTCRRCWSTTYFTDAVADGAGRLAPGGRSRAARPASRRRRSRPALAYYDGLRAERLPAALIQGLRDFFGAHTYRRVDSDGSFHTLWSGDRSEVQS